MKDPIAIFSVEWLVELFEFRTIVTIRHPAAFAGSLKVKNWTFPFSHFLNQPPLMDGPLSKFSEEISEFSKRERGIDIALELYTHSNSRLPKQT